MQAYAITVLDSDSDRADQLYNELQQAGHAVTRVSLFVSDPPAPAAAAPAVELEPSTGTVDAAAGSDAPDNALPFKCPACGRTYATSTLCSVGHAPEATLPTEVVLAGAPPAAANQDAQQAAAAPEGAAAATDQSAGGATTPAAAPPAGSGEARPAAGAGPSWPNL